MATPGAMPPPMGMFPWYRTRVANHLQPLGILWCLFGAYRIVGGVTGAFVLHTVAHSGMFGDAPPFVAQMVGTMGPVVLVMGLFLGAASVATGYGLLTRQPWARTLAIVMAILSLIKPIMGTALGIYTLWALAPAASGMEWENLQTTRPLQQA
jgi:hypothetical protein